MAPITLNLLDHTMSNPNTNALMSLLENAARTRKSSAAGFKTIYVGPDKLPISLLQMAPLTSPVRIKNASFDSLSLAM